MIELIIAYLPYILIGLTIGTIIEVLIGRYYSIEWEEEAENQRQQDVSR